MSGVCAAASHALHDPREQCPNVQHSLGLLLVRLHDYPGALDLLRGASELAPDNARYSYV